MYYYYTVGEENYQYALKVINGIEYISVIIFIQYFLSVHNIL